MSKINNMNVINYSQKIFLLFVKKSLSNKVNEIILNRKWWNQLWDAITAPGSIWEEAVSRNESFYRDKIGCFAHCPFKTKTFLNYKQSKDSFIAPNFSSNCIIVLNNNEYESEFSLYENRFEIVKNNNHKKVVFYTQITEILPRSRFHKKNSIEVFLKTNKSYFICFYDDQKNIMSIYKGYPLRSFCAIKINAEKFILNNM